MEAFKIDIQSIFNKFEKSIGNPGYLSDSDNLTKYIVAKGLLNGVEDEEGLKELISKIEGLPVCRHFLPSDSIFSDEFQEYVKFECTTEDINQNLLGKLKGFRVQNVDKFKNYLYRKNYDSSLSMLAKESESILILGPVDVGKTRTAYELLKSDVLKGYYVFSFLSEFWPDIDALKFSNSINRSSIKLIWFIDELHYFHNDTQRLHDKLTNNFDEVIVIATQRSDKIIPDKPILDSMTEFYLKPWKEYELNELAGNNGIPIKYEFGNTPSTLIDDFRKLKKNYKFYQKKGKEHTLHALHYVKLLFEFLELVTYELFEVTFLHLRKKLSTKDDFEHAVSELIDTGFIEIREGYLLSKDIFFVEIITDEYYHNITTDLKKLIPIFSKLGQISNLLRLANYYCSFDSFKNANECFELVEKNIDKMKDKVSFPRMFNNWGITLTRLNLYEEACKKYREALKIRPRYAEVHINLGLALIHLKLFKEAFEHLDMATVLKPKYSEAYFHYGHSLSNFGQIKGNAKIIKNAIKKLKTAIQYKSKYPEAFFEWGRALIHMAQIKGDHDLFKKSIKKFEIAITHKPKYPEAYYFLSIAYLNLKREEDACNMLKAAIRIKPYYAEALSRLGGILMFLRKYDETCILFKKFIRCKPQYAEAYNHWGVALSILKKFNEAFKKFEISIKLNPNLAVAYRNYAYALEESDSGKEGKKMILELYAAAFLIFIVAKRWREANMVAASSILNKFQKAEYIYIYNVVLVFNTAIELFLKTKKNSKADALKFRVMRDEVTKENFYTILFDAIFENKRPESEIDPRSNDLKLAAAITLANEIVTIRSLSSSA